MMEKILKKLNNRKGFTLIELIVVIAIIGILAAILIPQFVGFSDKAREKAVLAEAKTVQTAINAYMAEEDSTPTTKAQLNEYIEGEVYANIAGDATGGVYTYNGVDGWTASVSSGGITINEPSET